MARPKPKSAVRKNQVFKPSSTSARAVPAATAFVSSAICTVVAAHWPVVSSGVAASVTRIT